VVVGTYCITKAFNDNQKQNDRTEICIGQWTNDIQKLRKFFNREAIVLRTRKVQALKLVV
jgi:hypothetical protein